MATHGIAAQRDVCGLSWNLWVGLKQEVQVLEKAENSFGH